MNKRVAVGMVIIIAAMTYFGFAGFQEGKAYYKTIEELQAMGNDAFDKRIKVAGIVAEGSIEREGTDVVFLLEQDDLKLSVRYTGTTPVPDTFKDHSEAICDGKYLADGTFEATLIQAKCASKYEAEYLDKKTEH